MSNFDTALRNTRTLSVTLADEAATSEKSAPAAVQVPGAGADYAAIFWRRGGLLICTTALGILLAVAIALLQAPRYQAHASIELDGVNDMYLSSREVTAEDNTSTTDAYMQTQAMVIGSDPVIRGALKKIPQQRAPSARWSVPGLSISSLEQKLGMVHPAGPSSRDDVLDQVRQCLTVRNVPMTRVVEVTFESTNRGTAAQFVSALLETYMETARDRRLDAARNTEQWLNAYLSPLRQSLERSSSTLESYAHLSGLTGRSDDDTPAQAELRDLQSELTKAHAERVSKQAAYETYAKGPRDNVSTAINPSPLREYQSKLSDLRSQYAEAIATLTPAHYKVQRLEAQMHEMERLIDAEWSKTLDLIRSDYLASMRREALLTDSVAAQVSLVAEQAGKRVHYDMLHRDLETNQQIYSNVLQKANESAVLSYTNPSTGHVLIEARAPLKPFRPNIPIEASLGGLTGLFLGVTWIAFTEFRSRHLIAPGVPRGVTHIRELAVIPATSLDGGIEKAELSLSRRQHIGRLLPATADSFLFSESFQSAVAAIKRSQSTGTPLRILTVSSPMPGDGKTTIVTNLGLALANACHKVVLVEGDLRRPKLSRNFDTANSWGLSDLLQSSNRIEDMPFEALVKATGKPGLFVLPSGPSTAAFPSLLHSVRMGELLEALKKHADLILIDSPPLLAVSDARILASASDAVILVVRAHKTPRETLAIAVQQLIDDQTPILGSILNAWDPRRAPGARDPFRYQYSYPG